MLFNIVSIRAVYGNIFRSILWLRLAYWHKEYTTAMLSTHILYIRFFVGLCRALLKQ